MGGFQDLYATSMQGADRPTPTAEDDAVSSEDASVMLRAIMERRTNSPAGPKAKVQGIPKLYGGVIDVSDAWLD